MPLWIQLLVDAAGIVLVTLALLIAMANADRGAHSSHEVKPQTAPYTARHVKLRRRREQGPHGGAHPQGMAVAA